MRGEERTILTKEEIDGCREALRLSNANIETHIANALCDMALHASGLEENLREEMARMHRYRGQVHYEKVKRRWTAWEA